MNELIQEILNLSYPQENPFQEKSKLYMQEFPFQENSFQKVPSKHQCPDIYCDRICNECSKIITRKYISTHKKKCKNLGFSECLKVQKPISQYKCCNRLFVTRYNMNRHYKSVHTNIKEYKCSKCPREFMRKYIMTNHEKKCLKK